MRARPTWYSEQARNDAYGEILDHVKGKQKIILECIISYYPISDKAISEITGIPVHLVTARRNELWGKEKNPLTGKYEINPDKQLIEFAGYDTTVKPKQSLWQPIKKQAELKFT